MNMDIISTQFHLPHRIIISASLSVPWLFLIPYIDPSDIFSIAILLVTASMSIFGVYYISVMSINHEGITLYRINKLSWSEISESNQFRFFGLTHIKVTRKRGIPWSLPAYFVGSLSVKEALLKYAPPDSPIYSVANDM